MSLYGRGGHDSSGACWMYEHSMRHNPRIATTVALISVISSAVVALGVVLITGRFEATRARWQVAVSRLDELRGVLDDAASHADAALYEANGVWSLLEQDRAEPDPKSVLARFERQMNAAGSDRLRIALRVGERSELFMLYDDVLKPLWEVWDVEVASVHDGAPFDPEAAERLLKQAATAKSRFLNRSSELVGADLNLIDAPRSRA
jgi:hypothetical protein